ncbi:MAG TPA: acyl-CoA dehydrogenase family protein [Candidatus Dormibacteraeota bacterium]
MEKTSTATEAPAAIYGLTAEQVALRSRTRIVADSLVDLVRISDKVVGYDDAWREAMAKLHQEGYFAMSVPRQFGGHGSDLISLVLVQEQLSRVDGGLANCISHEACASRAIESAEATIRDECFQKMLAGSLTCIAITEPHSGSDLGAMRTTAVRGRGGYVINGSKTIASLAGAADIFLIWAKTDENSGTKGISTFIASASDPGITVGEAKDTLGFRQLPHHDVEFKNLEVPESARIGAEGEGMAIFAEALNVGRLGGGAQALGIAAGAFEHAREFAAGRTTFGKPFAEHQAIQFTLADMVAAVEAGRLLIYDVARFMDGSDLRSRDVGTYAALVKMYESDMAMRVTEDAVEIFGAQGIWKSNDVERLFRDAKVTQIVDGPNELMRMRIGHALVRPRPKAQAE